jgi:hypothetical protein
VARRKLSRIGQKFLQHSAITKALKRAAMRAIHQHENAGLPLVVWRNGKTVRVPAWQLDGRRRKGSSGRS